MSADRGGVQSGLRVTPANALTLLRLALVPLLGVAILHDQALTASALFAGAVATDFADGAVARRRREVTAFGGLLDHAADATLCVVGLAAWACRGEIPVLLAPLVAAAFTQYALDSRVLAGRPLRTSKLGRWNGIAYYVLVGVPIGRDLVGFVWPGPAWMRVAGWLLLVSTLASMVDRWLAQRRASAP
ncbi:CDP-alcohol phosphatidyltransferase family protein [Myxococcota bacterium]|nr:CDP-alcohol phosphatidyltransferase family protein [Myxococcota bacterium]MCZ7617014.1 CDP-alcohol phosphatidyltransferase family protein [Myxococcota bacterium]